MFRKFAPVLACVTLLVSGCGGDGDGSSPSGSSSDANAAKPLTKAEYVAQGNKICRDTKKAQEPFDDRADELDRDDLQAAGQLFEEAFAVTRDGYEKLKALSPPAAEEARVTEYHRRRAAAGQPGKGRPAATRRGSRGSGEGRLG